MGLLPTSAASWLSPGCLPFLPEVVCPRGRWQRRTLGAWLVMSCSVLRLTREPVAESPKKKRWEAPSSLHPPRGAGSTTRGGGAQSQRGTPGAGGAGRARGSSFAKFGNRNVFMKDHSSSSSTDSRSRSSSRSPTRHFRRRCAGFRWGWACGGASWRLTLLLLPTVTPTRTLTVLTQGMSVSLWAAGTHPPRAGEVGGPTWIGAEAGHSEGRGEQLRG